jgi:hypothetical protein
MIRIHRWILRNLGLIIRFTTSKTKMVECPADIIETRAEYYVIKRKDYYKNFSPKIKPRKK